MQCSSVGTSYVFYHPEPQQLLPPALQDWLTLDHLVYFTSDTVDSLNLAAFHARYAAGGWRNQPRHTAMMVKVLVLVLVFAYAYANGVFSPRKIAKKLFADTSLSGCLQQTTFRPPRTIRDFRAQHLGEFTELFTQIVRLARELGQVLLGTIAVDGTKIKAHASRHKAMSYTRMQTTEAELKAQIPNW